MSKLDSKLLAVTPFTVNPIQIVQEALKMFSVEARRVDIDLKMVIDQSYHDMGMRFLDLDPSRMKQVLINLLTNALKFTKTKSTRNVCVKIKASTERPTNESSGVEFIPRAVPVGKEEVPQPALEGRGDPVFLLFEVQDTGQGLDENEKKNLFQRFGQGSDRTHVNYGGSGLGLFISRSLAELQRGAIGVSSSPGVGSTFAFYIEAYHPSEEALTEAALNAAALSVTHSHSRTNHHIYSDDMDVEDLEEPPVVINGILVVEDNLVNQRITRRGLQDAGFVVDVANHGAEALEKLNQTEWAANPIAPRPQLSLLPPPIRGQNKQTNNTLSGSSISRGKPLVPLSVVLMDMEMPVMDGLTCTRRIREMEKLGLIRGHVPIIAVSANARTEQILEAKAAGCDDVLVKPYRMPELIEKMQVVIQRLSDSNKSGRLSESMQTGP